MKIKIQLSYLHSKILIRFMYQRWRITLQSTYGLLLNEAVLYVYEAKCLTLRQATLSCNTIRLMEGITSEV